LRRLNKMNQILNRIYNLLTFFKSKRKKLSFIPESILNYRKSIHHAEKNAAIKVVTYCKKHYLKSSMIHVLFNAELQYEKEKYRIQHEYPHLKEIVKEDIHKAKDEKYAVLKEELGESDYQKYRAHRRMHKEKQ
jgi:hypothetical protein